MSGAVAYHVVKMAKEKASRIEKCNTCAYYNPQAHHCGRYLRGVETAIYLCHRIEENEEMKSYSRKPRALKTILEARADMREES